MKWKPTRTDDGRAIAVRIRVYDYLECSAKMKDGVREGFETATSAALQKISRLSGGVGIVAIYHDIYQNVNL